jgi:hypothetical protein
MTFSCTHSSHILFDAYFVLLFIYDLFSDVVGGVDCTAFSGWKISEKYIWEDRETTEVV